MTSGETLDASTVTVCRGCCCGTDKHPGVDHASQLRLLATAGVAARVRVSDCLGPCEHSNVMVVQPSPLGRQLGGRPVWLSEVLADDAVAAIVEWVRDGGPGKAELPGRLVSLVVVPPRREENARRRLGAAPPAGGADARRRWDRS